MLEHSGTCITCTVELKRTCTCHTDQHDCRNFHICVDINAKCRTFLHVALASTSTAVNGKMWKFLHFYILRCNTLEIYCLIYKLQLKIQQGINHALDDYIPTRLLLYIRFDLLAGPQPTSFHVRPAKIHISLCVRVVCSESLYGVLI